MQLSISKLFKSMLCGSAFFCFSTAVMANQNSPVGYWKIMDEETKQPASIVQITDNQDNLTGKVVKLLNNPDAICTKCSGEQQNKPILGMTILWGFQAKNDSFTEGKILATRRGAIFDAGMQIAPDGQTLTLIVKTGFGEHKQVWQRVSNKNG
jgi:hypothetical protein